MRKIKNNFFCSRSFVPLLGWLEKGPFSNVALKMIGLESELSKISVTGPSSSCNVFICGHSQRHQKNSSTSNANNVKNLTEVRVSAKSKTPFSTCL
jgi:hypothetical protein